MAKHASDDWLTTAAKWPGLDDDPLGMRRGRIIREAADLPLLAVHQPADTLPRRVPIDEWPVLVRHQQISNTCLFLFTLQPDSPNVVRNISN